MIELRCRFKKAAEFDPASLRLVYRCPTCSKDKKTDVLHEWSIASLLGAIESGQTDGILEPDNLESMVKCKDMKAPALL